MKQYQLYATWQGYAIVRHDARWLPTQHVATFHYSDKAIAEAVCRDLNKGVSRG
jgi:hypothetical protein